MTPIEELIEEMKENAVAPEMFWIKQRHDFFAKYLEKEKEHIKPLIDALNDIKNWDDELDEQWGDPGLRAKEALVNYNQNK